MTTPTGSSSVLRALTKPIWWFGVLLSGLVGAMFYCATSKSIEHDTRERFGNHARTAQHAIGAQIKSYGDLLRGTASLLQLSGGANRAQFHLYVSSLALAQHFPAIESINFARYFTDRQRARVEAELLADDRHGADGYPPYALKPAGRRATYSVLTFLEPITSAPERFGHDIAAEPARGAKLDAARDLLRMINSNRLLPLESRPGFRGMTMRLPVYRSDMPATTIDQRRAAYYGSVGIGFNLDLLIAGVLGEIPVKPVRLELYDGGADGKVWPTLPPGTLPLYDSQAAPDQRGAPAVGGDDVFVTTLPIGYNGRIWNARFSAPKNSLYSRLDRRLPWLAAGAGFIGSMLIYALIHTLSSSRARALEMAKAMTRELRASQARLQLSHQNLRLLAAHADLIKEEERKRIAREIHDDLGQNLLALRIEADILAARTAHQHPRLHARVCATLLQIDATIKSVRNIINDLRPTVLDLGLSAAVEWQVAQFQRRTGIACELSDRNSEIRVNDHCATAFFRILQESLSNISQHARASLVQVELRQENGLLSMTVRDNGVGLNGAGSNKAGSFGLVGIEERIKLLGGHSSVASLPDGGLTIHVSAPTAGNAAYPCVPEMHAAALEIAAWRSASTASP